MAKKQIVTYSYACDVCGNEIAETVENAERRISWDGRDYEVDLCEKDQRGLDKAIDGLKVYLDVGRRAVGAARRSAPTRSVRGKTKPLRQWARTNGWPKLGERGRIPAEAQTAWEKAGSPSLSHE